MKAIRTKFHGPGNVKGARVSASDEDGNRITISWNHSLPLGEANHRAAARALCQKMGWKGRLVAGALKDGYAFCFLPGRAKRERPEGWGRAFATPIRSRIRAALVESLQGGNAEPTEHVAFGTVVELVARAILRTDSERYSFAKGCGLADIRTEQTHVCQPECDCPCHVCSIDACRACEIGEQEAAAERANKEGGAS